MHYMFGPADVHLCSHRPSINAPRYKKKLHQREGICKIRIGRGSNCDPCTSDWRLGAGAAPLFAIAVMRKAPEFGIPYDHVYHEEILVACARDDEELGTA